MNRPKASNPIPPSFLQASPPPPRIHYPTTLGRFAHCQCYWVRLFMTLTRRKQGIGERGKRVWKRGKVLQVNHQNLASPAHIPLLYTSIFRRFLIKTKITKVLIKKKKLSLFFFSFLIWEILISHNIKIPIFLEKMFIMMHQNQHVKRFTQWCVPSRAYNKVLKR